MSTFDQAEFDANLDDIEKYLGYLKGNELAWQYLMRVKTELDSQGANYNLLSGDYVTPCPDGAFTYQPQYAVPVLDGTSEQIDLDVEAKILQGANESWHNGPRWAAGVADQARSITEQVTKPDAAVLRDAVQVMDSDVLRKFGSATVDWGVLGNLPEQWSGESADAFVEFQTDFTGLLLQYAQFSAYAAATLAAATKVIEEAQRGLMRTVREIRENLHKQLEAWNRLNAPWMGPNPMIGWILDILAVGKALKGIKLLFKIARRPEEAADVMSDLLYTLGTALGAQAGGDQSGEEKKAEAEADHLAQEFLSTLIDSLHKVYVQDFQALMDDLSVGAVSSTTMRDEVTVLENGRRWYPEVIPNNARLTRPGDRYPG